MTGDNMRNNFFKMRQMILTEYNHVIQTLATNRTDYPFHEWILPRTPGRLWGFPWSSFQLSDSGTLHHRFRKRYRGAVSSEKVSMICCVVQTAVGYSVTLNCKTRLRWCAATT